MVPWTFDTQQVISVNQGAFDSEAPDAAKPNRTGLYCSTARRLFLELPPM
jgi:hypothetical protein